MTLPTSRNPISFSQIEAEFGGNSTNSFGGYRMGTPESYGGKTFDELIQVYQLQEQSTMVPLVVNKFMW